MRPAPAKETAKAKRAQKVKAVEQARKRTAATAKAAKAKAAKEKAAKEKTIREDAVRGKGEDHPPATGRKRGNVVLPVVRLFLTCSPQMMAPMLAMMEQMTCLMHHYLPARGGRERLLRTTPTGLKPTITPVLLMVVISVLILRHDMTYSHETNPHMVSQSPLECNRKTIALGKILSRRHLYHHHLRLHLQAMQALTHNCSALHILAKTPRLRWTLRLSTRDLW
jgi:hypothetical protein